MNDNATLLVEETIDSPHCFELQSSILFHFNDAFGQSLMAIKLVVV